MNVDDRRFVRLAILMAVFFALLSVSETVISNAAIRIARQVRHQNPSERTAPR